MDWIGPRPKRRISRSSHGYSPCDSINVSEYTRTTAKTGRKGGCSPWPILYSKIKSAFYEHFLPDGPSEVQERNMVAAVIVLEDAFEYVDRNTKRTQTAARNILSAARDAAREQLWREARYWSVGKLDSYIAQHKAEYQCR